jgi:hypothetical protein
MLRRSFLFGSTALVLTLKSDLGWELIPTGLDIVRLYGYDAYGKKIYDDIPGSEWREFGKLNSVKSFRYVDRITFA